VDEYYSISEQDIHAFANFPMIRTPDGGRAKVTNPDLWLASKINSTLKKGFASDVYWEKAEKSPESQQKFVEGVRNHSWNRQHMGAMVVANVDVELKVSSLVSSAITLGKFYKIQQQTRRSVLLDEVASIPSLTNNPDVKSSFDERFKWYRSIVDPRKNTIKGFDRYVQDSFKILPLSTMTKIIGNWDLRTVKGYSRWRNMDYLPSSIRDFSSHLSKSVEGEYPIFFKSYLFDEREVSGNDKLILKMAERIGSNDIMDEPMLWYKDHSFLLPKNHYYEQVHETYDLDHRFKTDSPDGMLLSTYNPFNLKLEDLLKIFKEKTEEQKSPLEMTMLTFVSRLDLSGAIDTWRHTRNNRIVQSIYHALENPTIAVPELLRRREDTEAKDEFLRLSWDAIDLYKQLVKEGIPREEAINVLPHSLMLSQIETMDLFSFLNLVGLRTCTHARPEVQVWAKSLLRSLGESKDFSGIHQVLGENILAHALMKGYCGELGGCRACGKDIVYLPDPFVQ